MQYLFTTIAKAGNKSMLILYYKLINHI